uniref:Uncharacterized protein n=1 Tax=Gasterosteus aculeatus TaxID=69293 RepID=G3NNC0_GASAC
LNQDALKIRSFILDTKSSNLNPLQTQDSLTLEFIKSPHVIAVVTKPASNHQSQIGQNFTPKVKTLPRSLSLIALKLLKCLRISCP